MTAFCAFCARGGKSQGRGARGQPEGKAGHLQIGRGQLDEQRGQGLQKAAHTRRHPEKAPTEHAHAQKGLHVARRARANASLVARCPHRRLVTLSGAIPLAARLLTRPPLACGPGSAGARGVLGQGVGGAGRSAGPARPVLLALTFRV
jgi:hypothetical protein